MPTPKTTRLTSGIRLCAAVGDAGAADYGSRWEVRVVDFGPDKQGLIYWDPAALKAAMPLYEGAKVFALSEAQHQATAHPYGKSVRDLVGWIDEVSADETGFKGYFNILKSAQWLRDAMVDAWGRGKKDLIGLSNDVGGTTTTKVVAGKTMRAPLVIHNVTIDVVYDPAAGGGFVRMAAAMAGQMEETMEKMLAALKEKRPDLYASIEAKVKDGSITEDEVMEKLKAAMAVPAVVCSACGGAVDAAKDNFCPACGCGLKAAQGKAGDGHDAKLKAAGSKADKGSQDANITASQKALDETRLIACGLTLDRELGKSRLPELSQEKLRKSFEGKPFATESLTAAITGEKEYIDKLMGAGSITGAGGVSITEEDLDKRAKMLDDFFEGKVASIKAAYVNLTGDALVTGRLTAANRLRASIDSGSFPLMLGDSITRRMVADYKAAGLSDWRKIADVVPLADMRTNRRVRMGGYGDLPTVAQGAPYAALGTPAEEESTYTPSKKGGTEEITLEAIKNDDVGAIRRIPTKLSRAAARTLYKFVFNFLASNSVIYDSKALFHADHGNLGSAALDAASYLARRLAMFKQTELTSAEVLGIPPKYLILPVDLEKTGYDLTAAPRNSDFNPTTPDFTRTLQMELIVVPFWTDPNDWCLAADKNDIPGIEIGFLDGKEEPELFVQDLPNVGSMFNNDKLTYKLRHIYGGSVLDARAFDGSRVA